MFMFMTVNRKFTEMSMFDFLLLQWPFGLCRTKVFFINISVIEA